MSAGRDGSVAVVTGASSGIGAATARTLAARGYRVVLSARRVDRLRAVADEIAAEGGEAAVVPADMRIESEILKIFTSTRERLRCSR